MKFINCVNGGVRSDRERYSESTIMRIENLISDVRILVLNNFKENGTTTRGDFLYPHMRFNDTQRAIRALETSIREDAFNKFPIDYLYDALEAMGETDFYYDQKYSHE